MFFLVLGQGVHRDSSGGRDRARRLFQVASGGLALSLWVPCNKAEGAHICLAFKRPCVILVVMETDGFPGSACLSLP